MAGKCFEVEGREKKPHQPPLNKRKEKTNFRQVIVQVIKKVTKKEKNCAETGGSASSLLLDENEQHHTA